MPPPPFPPRPSQASATAEAPARRPRRQSEQKRRPHRTSLLLRTNLSSERDMRGEAVARLGDPTVEPAAVVLEPRCCSAGRAATLGVVDETAEMDGGRFTNQRHWCQATTAWRPTGNGTRQGELLRASAGSVRLICLDADRCSWRSITNNFRSVTFVKRPRRDGAVGVPGTMRRPLRLGGRRTTRQVVTVRVAVGGTGLICPPIDGAIPISCVPRRGPQTVIPATN